MGYFDRADRLLHKRCDFLESHLSWPTTVQATPPEGKHYRHFIGQGLTVYRTADYNYDSSFNYSHKYTPALMGSHHRGLYGAHYQLERSVSVTRKDWELFGDNPFDHQAHLELGYELRYGWAINILKGLHYGSALSLKTNFSIDQVKQLYKGRELIPASQASNWDLQQLSLLEQAREHSLKELLGARHVVATDNSAYGWSAQDAGFNAGNFTGSSLGEGFIPTGVYGIGRTTEKGRLTAGSGILHHCPTIMLVTMELPTDFDEWLATGGSADDSLQVVLHQRWVSVPHWVGYACTCDYLYHSPYSFNYMHDHRYVSDYTENLTSLHIIDQYNKADGAYGDTMLYTPADDSYTDLRPPYI